MHLLGPRIHLKPRMADEEVEDTHWYFQFLDQLFVSAPQLTVFLSSAGLPLSL